MFYGNGWLFACLLAGMCGLAQAAPVGPVDVRLNGTLIAPPLCSVSQGRDIDVNFGSVGTNKVDGIKYKHQIPYTIECAPNADRWDLGLTLNGTPASFDAAAIAIPGMTNFGLHVTLGGTAFELNRRKPLADSPGKDKATPVLEVVPVKQPGTTLAEGNFSVTATLVADYQ